MPFQTLRTWARLLINKETLAIYPFFLHTFWMSLFASIIGPFGGFFASGFKRAFKIKDFGDIIPGHGGIMDRLGNSQIVRVNIIIIFRFDCQFLMATFVNVYIHSFINLPTPGKIIQQVFLLLPEEQLELFRELETSLLQRGILQP